MDKSLITFLEAELSTALKKSTQILKYTSVSGGSINNCYQLQSEETSFFVKTNSASRYPKMFEKEASGLILLNANSSFAIPEVIAVGTFENTAFLILSFIFSNPQHIDFWKDFAKNLAELHRCSTDQFGLKQDNFIGSLSQENTQSDSWVDFFINQRLEPLIKKAFDQGLMPQETIQKFQQLFGQLASIIPEEKPALIHGDLWSGNFCADDKGNATIYDPAVYYGHREMDIAMSMLFGGFQREFYRHYNEMYPMETGWEDRIDIHNLYPLLVHLNLFGSSYFSGIQQVLRRYA